MMLDRLSGGASISKLATKYDVAPATVKRRLATTREEGVLDKARRIFLDDMLPQSMGVLQAALKSDDERTAVKVALAIVAGLKAMDGMAAAAGGAGAVEETLEAWRIKRVVHHPAAVSDPRPPRPTGAVIDVVAERTESVAPSEKASAAPAVPVPHA